MQYSGNRSLLFGEPGGMNAAPESSAAEPTRCRRRLTRRKAHHAVAAAPRHDQSPLRLIRFFHASLQHVLQKGRGVSHVARLPGHFRISDMQCVQ